MVVRGVQFVTDTEGRKVAVLLDLEEWGELWEDIYDNILADDDRLEEPHHFGGLPRVGVGAYAEMNVGPGQAEVAEEGVRHQLVVVLPRVHDERRERARAPPHRLDHGRDLHEVGPRPDDVDDLDH